MKKLVDDFFRDNDLSWNVVSAVCSELHPCWDDTLVLERW